MRDFGKTGWRVNPIGLGCWQFGGAITLDGLPDGWAGIRDEDSVAAIHRALDLGVNFFDTADMYGWGHSEELIGRVLKERRAHVFVATKCGYWHDEAGRRIFNESRDYILRACDASLRRLQLDHIDLYQCHLSRTERWGEFLNAFEQLQQAGKIRYFGISTHEFSRVTGFNSRHNLAAVQTPYNLLSRQAEEEILPYCRQHNIAVIARGPLAMGKLSGKYSKVTRFDANEIRSKWLNDPANREAFSRDIETVERLKPIAAQAGCTLPQLALRFVLAHPVVSIVIPGAKNAEQVEQNVAAGNPPLLTADELTAIDRAT